MSLTPEQQALRAGKVTASFVPKLMAGDEAAIMREWMKLTEHPDYAPEDLSDKWAPMFGSFAEPFILDWHQRKTGHSITMRGKVINHPNLPHVCCTLDGWRKYDDTAIDAKLVGAWQKIDAICSFYAPQVVVQKGCTHSARGALLIVHGSAEPVEYPIEVSSEYAAEVFDKIDAFWQCVVELRPPYEIKPSEPAVIESFREIDMQSSNAWARWAGEWLDCRDTAAVFATAVTEIKALVPKDGKRCYGHGIIASRSKNGAITIKAGE